VDWLKKLSLVMLVMFSLGIVFITQDACGAPLVVQKDLLQKDLDIPDSPGLVAVPKAPSNLTAGSGYEEIVLRWQDNSFNEDGFIIERQTAGGEFFPVDRVGPNVETYTDTGATFMLHPNEKYFYRVKAYRGKYESVSNVTNGNWFYTVIPLPPYDFKAEPFKHNEEKIKLSWTNPQNKETKYYLQTSIDGKIFINQPKPLTSTVMYLYKKDLAVDVTHHYRIKAVNPNGTSYSDTVKVTLPHLPARPENFQGTAQSTTSIKLTWTDKSDNEDGFFIYRKKMGESYSFKPAITTGPNVQEYVDTGLEADTWYCYTINPFNGNNQVAATSEIKARTAPHAPTDISAAPYIYDTVKVSWVNHSKVTTFIMERKKEGGEWVKDDFFVLPPVGETSSYVDQNVEPGTTYTYRLYAVAVDENGNRFVSEPSAETSITTPGSSTGNAAVNPLATGKNVIRLNVGKTSYSVDGQTLDMDTAPVVSQGRTMLPIRYITDQIGATLAWNEADQQVTIVKGDMTIELWIGKNTARVNGTERMIDSDNPNVKPFIAPPGRTMLPLRFISESLGCTVNWDAERQEASIEY